MLEPEGTEETYLTEVEEALKEKFSKDKTFTRVPSTARDSEASARVRQLVLPDSERPRMPFTQDKYVIKENPQLVEWERITRQFLRKLSPRHGHRVAATMIYEWATGILVKDLVAQGGTASPDLRKLNQILRFYFGKSYVTYIMGRKTTNAYRVPAGYYIRRHRPMTLTLYAEYAEGTLNP